MFGEEYKPPSITFYENSFYESRVNGGQTAAGMMKLANAAEIDSRHEI
jgi:hypothetical protein